MKRVFSGLLAVLLVLWGLSAAALDLDPSALSDPESDPPAAAPEPEPDPDPSPDGDPAEPAPTPQPEGLHIDNEHCYAHMERCYAQGYVPTVDGDTAFVVVPLLCDVPLRGDRLRARVDLGDPMSGPFAAKTYEKTVRLAQNPVDGGPEQVEGYLVTFELALRDDRLNGSFPVTVRLSGRDGSGTPVELDCTVFVTVTDGADPDPEPQPQPEEPVILAPKVLVASAQVEGADGGTRIAAGTQARVHVFLRNTSDTQDLTNMAVSAALPGEGFVLQSPSDSVFVGDLEAGGTAELVWAFAVEPETPAGAYAIPLVYDFAYGSGETGSGSGNAWIQVTQPLKMEFALLQLPGEAVVSDTVEATVQAVNLSHADAGNVRATLEADGLLPAGVAFLGDVAGGESKQAALSLRVTALTQGAAAYGETRGTVTFQWEDADGQSFTETQPIALTIRSPFSAETREEPDDPGQWWILLGAAAAIVLILAALLGVRALRRRRS